MLWGNVIFSVRCFNIRILWGGSSIFFNAKKLPNLPVVSQINLNLYIIWRSEKFFLR